MPAILNPGAGRHKFDYRAAQPARALGAFVDHYWFVSWDLRGQEPYEQQVLPYPAVHLTFKENRCRVAGVPRGRFSEVLSGAGRVFGVRFLPGGFRPFLGASVSSITDRFLPLDAVFGTAAHDLAAAVLAADDVSAVSIMDDFLSARAPARPLPAAELAATVVGRIAAEPRVTRVDVLAGEVGLTVRQLQRLFAEYVGVGPKWVIRRFRQHEAAARAASGVKLDLARLASELGYSDQAHLSRDFSGIAGLPPSRYAEAELESPPAR
ncbi:AraC family transcriptional regulator [Nonomuraea sp. NN258]|uniref:helix-turn-helix domain-containing protein n=1 Tax=Nonomuraea antri TaxID=2730852 RepID=UPI00156837C2|nr:helix-turn-helix domain-containing protein [Nonomuraea antri]NRQ39470.1 AraC family transcriptional regulator [Nonomuraea antri]